MHTVRRVLPHEYSKYRKHLKSLDLESRILRFGFAIKDEVIDNLCDGFEKDPSQHVLFCVEDTDLKFIGVGHIALPGKMELAFSVLKEARNQGVGSAIMDRVVRYCRTKNLLKGQMVCLSSNTAIKRLCTKHGIKMINDHGETYGEIELEPASFSTVLQEQSASRAAVADYFIKRAVNFLTSPTK